MELYGNAPSPATRSIRILSLELGLECDYFEIGLGATEPWLPEPLNPECRSPMLEDDGVLLGEASAILAYLADKAGAIEWYPEDLVERAQANQWLAWQGSRLAPQVARLAWERRFAPATQQNEQHEQGAELWLATLLKELEQQLQARSWLVNAQPGIADIAVATQLDDLQTSGYDLSPYPGTSVWLEEMRSRPTFTATIHSELSEDATRP
ncbi:MAG: glutathione S-transferase family protein [Gammaproteobacteria bacterium]|nr:glutathione S-transferase family protein [Gammaproteobacteria bacterium]